MLRNVLSVLALVASAAPAAFAQLPQISSVTSTSAQAPGPVTIVGANFEVSSLVTLEGVPATVLSQTPTQIVAQPAPGLPGFEDVRVTNSAGSTTVFDLAERWPSLTATTTGLGGTATVTLANGQLGSHVTALGLSLLPTPLGLGALFYHGLVLDPTSTLYVVGVGAFTPGGAATVQMTVPNDPALLGIVFHFQSLASQGAPATSFSFTNVGSISVGPVGPPPSGLSYSVSPASYSPLVPIAPNVPTVTGAVTTWSLSPALPAGLLFDLNTGRITGTPLAASPETAYTVTAANAAGSTQAVVRIAVFAGGAGYFADANQGGTAPTVKLLDAVWGRVVDVHDVGTSGVTNPEPVFRDLVVSESIQSDGANYRLETVPGTLRDRLVVLRAKGAPEPVPGSGTFDSLLAQATSGLPVVLPKDDAPGTLPPFSYLPRNAAIVLRFDDLLDDSPAKAASLVQDVRLAIGYPPTTPFAARVSFDPNHGGTTGGTFHSTRVLVDLTVSPLEAASLGYPAPVNLLGLPEGLASSTAANVSLRLPTQVSFATGQFTILTNVAGNPLSTVGTAPVDFGSPTIDLVRAARGGNAADPNGGFLADLTPPALLGAWPLCVDTAADDPAGRPGKDFLVDLTFTGPCRRAPQQGDVVDLGGLYAEVAAPAGAPGPGGQVTGVRVHVETTGGVLAGSLPGPGLYLSAHDPATGVPGACWVTFTPTPTTLPGTGVSPSSQVLARFSEPMDVGSLSASEGFVLVRGPSSSAPGASSIVVASTIPQSDLTGVANVPVVPLAHTGASEPYHVLFDTGVVDLAGNGLASTPSAVDFTIDPLAPPESNGGVVLRFRSADEVTTGAAAGNPDLRGQFLYDLTNDVIRPRPTSRSSITLDRNPTVLSFMVPFPAGLQTPLNPLGAKLQHVHRYADAGWNATDESFHNVDVERLAWVPLGGAVVADAFARYEIRLSHSAYLPDEAINFTLLPMFPSSGLVTSLFANNVLVDPSSPQTIVHPKTSGYTIDPTQSFLSPTGTVMHPYPLNLGPDPGAYTTYTWRDTAVLATGGTNGAGLPQEIEVLVGAVPGPSGTLASPGQVPSYGLPLLVEHRCYPSATALGLNALDVSLAINSSARPYFRVFSAGGVNTSGTVIQKDPDLETQPTGGFNPSSFPPGAPSRPADGVYHHGQLDLVVRVSRVHTVWIDTQNGNPDFFAPTLAPSAAAQPGNTSLSVDWRGATSIPGGAVPPFDASQVDPYGDVSTPITFFQGDATWKSSIDALDGARYVQARLTFLNDIALLAEAELDSLALAWLER